MTLSKIEIITLLQIHERCFFTTKMLKGATIGMPVHVAFYVEKYETSNDFDEVV